MYALVFVGLVAIAAAAAVLAFVLPPKPWGWLSAAVVVAVFAVLVATDWSWRWVPAILFGIAVGAYKRWRKRPAPEAHQPEQSPTAG